MPAAQQLLFPDPQPLVERLGRDFFRQLPLRWLAVHPQLGFSRLPLGWMKGRLDAETAIECGDMIGQVTSKLEGLLSGQPADFCEWIRMLLPADIHPFEKVAVEADLEFVSEGLPRVKGSVH